MNLRAIALPAEASTDRTIAVRLARVCATLVLTISIVSLIGWFANIPVLTSFGSGLTEMRANTAVCLLLFGTAVLLLALGTRASARAATILGGLVLLIATATAVEYMFKVDLRIDQLLVKDVREAGEQTIQGRMAPITIAAFILIGCAALLSRTRVRFVSALLSTATAAIGLYVILGYSFGISAFYDLNNNTPMALNTALAVLFASVGLLATFRRSWLTILFLRDSEASNLARRLIPAVIFVTMIASWVRYLLVSHQILTREAGFAALAVFNVTLLLAVIIVHAHLLRQHEASLRESKDLLEYEIEELARSEMRHRMLLEHASDGILLQDSMLNLVEVNAAFCNMVGLTPDQLIGRHASTLLFPEDLVAEPLHLTELNAGKVMVVQRRLRRSDGTSLDVEISSKRLPDGMIESIVRDVTERKLTLERLRINEERFRLVADASNEAILDVDRPAKAIWFNDRFRELFGVPPADHDERGRWIEAHVHPDDRERVMAMIRPNQAISNSTLPLTYRWIDDDGRLLHLLHKRTIITNPNGDVLRVVAAISDLTEVKQADAALRLSEDRFKGVYESNIIGVNFWSADGSVSAANDAFLEILGITRAEFDRGNINFLEFTAPESRPASLKALAQIHETGICEPFEKDYIRPDGSRVRVIVTAAALEIPDTGVAVTIDITEREKAVTAMRESEERFRAAVENSYDIVAIIDRNGKVKYESPAVERTLGYTPQELIGTDPFSRVHPEDRDAVVSIFRDGIRESRSTATAAFRYRKKDGHYIHLETVARNLIGQPGIDGIVLNSRDVTERRAYEKRLAQAERVSGLGRLAATMAHEFNNVLMGILPFAEVIRRKGGDGIASAAKHIENSVARGRRITHEVLRFTRPVDPTIACIPANDWLHDVVAELRGILADGYSLEVAPVEADLQIAGDRGQLTQAITNLVVNARDAMPNGGTITLRAAPLAISTGFVDLSISDTGTGIADSDRERIFEPLFTSKKGGTGLGLAVTHQIVTLHGGSITLDSRMGEGTTFHLLLPRGVAETGCTPLDGPAAPAVVRHGRRILLVEDEIAVADGLSMLLEDAGFVTRVVYCGGDALSAAEEIEPDLAILDVGLPDIDGADVAEMLTRKYPDLPIIFSTGHADLAQLNGRFAGERTGFIQKPYESETLLTMIDGLLRQPAVC